MAGSVVDSEGLGDPANQAGSVATSERPRKEANIDFIDRAGTGEMQRA
jgi:hypothetical protein